MKKLFIFSVIWLSVFMLIACQRDDGVRAGGEQGSDTYQPRTAPKQVVQDNTRTQEIRGQLIRVDVERRTFTIRVETGMEQTFKFDNKTTVTGLDVRPSKVPGKEEVELANRVRDLVGKEGSEVTIQWKDDGGAAKLATMVTVTDMATPKPRKGKK